MGSSSILCDFVSACAPAADIYDGCFNECSRLCCYLCNQTGSLQGLGVTGFYDGSCATSAGAFHWLPNQLVTSKT